MLCLKNLFRAKSARFIVTVCASAFIALATGISFSCSFLEDDGFFDKIEGEVSVANADKMNVYLRYATIKFGKTTPADAALYQVKNNVAFSVTAVTNSDYSFYRWAAFSTKDFDVAKQHMSMVYVNDDDYYANYGSLELDASVVKFENPRAETTNVTVLQTRDDIWIMPVIAVRPTIAGTFPGTSQTPVRNTKLRVQFSKPMDIESFEGNFIISQATRAADFSLKEDPITEKFKMEINEKGNLVTFSFIDTNEMFNPAVIVRLYFTDDIADSTGYTMAESKTLEWNIGTYVDTLPPLITEMTAGIGSDCSKFASTPTRLAKTATDDLSNSLYTGELLTHRVKNKVNLYVYAQDIAQANGERLESDVLMLGFRAKSITDLEGNAIDGNAEGNFIPNVIDTYAAGQNLSEINGAFRAITGGKSAGCLYTYDLSSLPDGLIQIEVYAVDSTGNDGLTGYDESIDDADGMGNGPRSVFVIKDNRAPAIENELEKIKSSSIVAPFGWYNKLTIDSVEIYDEAANPIRDFGHQKLAAAHENLKWICHLGSSTDWVAEADSTGWVPVSERYKIGAAAVDGDGEVSVTIRLMDDLGNISKAMQISSVHCDNTVPETGKIYCVDASGAQGLNSTKDVVVPESMLIKVPFTEELCGVKVFGLTIKASDGTKVENAFEHASILYSVEESPEKAEAVAIEADTSSLQDVLNSKGNVGASIFPNGIESLHVLQSSYNTGFFYIKNLTLGEADGMYTVTITLYDSALNKAGEKTVMLAHDTMPPVVNRVVIKNVVPRLVYNEEDSTYWLPRSAYDENKDAKYVTVAVTATENGSGVKVITLGENAHITEDTSFIIEGRAVSSDRCTIDAKTNTVTLFDYEQPDLYKQTGSIGFELTNIRLDKPNSEEGNKVSVSLQDFVDNTGSNENAGNFDLYIDDTSTAPIYQVFSDSQIPAIAEKSPALADGKADSATDEKTFAEARLVSVYTDTKNVDLSLKLSPETNGSGVRSLSLSNGLFTGETAVYVDGKLLAQTEYTLDGSIVTFVNYVFTAANTFKFTNVELQGSDDGLQLISITATDFTGWVSKEVSTPMITLDRAAPVVGEVTWHLKEGVYGVSKAAVVSNMDLCLPFTEVMTGVKVLRMDPKLNDSSSSATPFDSADFAIKYISNADIDALAESAGEGGETKPADTATLIENAKLLKAEADYTVKDNYITFTEPQKYTSGLFVLQNIKVADNFEDNKSYKINLHLADAALNGCAADGTIDLASDSTPPKIQRIFINRLIGRKQPGEAKEDSYWISKEDFEQAGKVPTKVELELTIAESGSGVEKVELGGNLRLTAASEITCGTTKLVKGSDYKVSSDFATITLITNSKPTFRSENGDFTVTITNATLTAEGENKISVKLTDFALNTDPDKSESTKIAYKADSTETVPSVFVDFTAPLLLEGGVKLVDRGGSEAINGTADEEANTVALEGFTNEKLVNVALKTAASDAGETKRSGVKYLVISSGARFTSSSKFYYKDLDAADTTALTHADAATNGDGYEEITGVERSSDNLTASLPYSYACEKVCEFIVTNVELTGEEGENQVSIYPVDLTGWSDSEKAVADKITLDTTAPAWGNNANAAAVVMGTIGENGNNADYVWPKTAGARILASDGEVYFYKRPQGTESEPIYLTVNASDTNFYGLYFVSDASDKSSGAVAVAAKESNKAILTKITDVKFDASSNHEYTIVLKDRAGNISTETKSVHVVKDGEAEIVNDDDESSSLQNNMEYKESRENYHIFKTSVPKILTREESDGVDGVSGVFGYAVYYNDGNGGKDGVNPVTIEVNLSKHKEKNFTINSGVAYYAINGSAQAPAAVLEGSYTAPTTALQNWNKWIPFTSGTTKLTLYPKNDGKNPLNMRLWFKDNVGNVKSVEIKQKTEAGLQTEPDIWICDNTIPQNTNGTTDGFVPENNQLSANGLDFDYMMPDHMWKVSSSATSTELKVMNAAGLESEKEKGKTDNRIFFSDNAKASFVINNEPSETVATESGEADSDNWAVRLFLYPSDSATTPSREVVMSWIKEDANKNKYFYGIPSDSTISTITLSNIEYPKECSETTPYIYVVAEDRVGNINISKLNVKVEAPSYNSTSNSTYWYGKFVYSADEEAPQIWLGGTGVHGNKTYVDVNADTFSSAADIAKLVPYNAGRRPYVDATAGKTWISSNKYSLTANSLAGYNTKHDYSTNDADKRLFFYVDVDTEIPYAYYYSHLATPDSVSTLSTSKIVDSIYSSNSSSWLILDTTSTTYNIDGKVPIPTVIGDNSYMTSSTAPTYLHVADKLGRVKSVRLGNTKYQHDDTPPTVNFTGLAANDKKGLYRLDYKDGKLTVTFALDAKKIIQEGGSVKVYIPTLKDSGTTGTYVSDSGSGLYGYSWSDHLEAETAEICRDDEDANCGFYSEINSSNANGYYLLFNNNTENSNGSLSISSANKYFYVLDKVGNSKAVAITSSVDDKPPELSMSFSAYSAANFTAGKIYDAITKNVIACNTTSKLDSQTFKGADSATTPKDELGYKVNKPYVIYSNALGTTTTTNSIGYILGTFVAKDQNGNDNSTTYSGMLTEIIVKRYVLNGTDTGASVDWENIDAITLPYALNPVSGQTKLEQDEETKAYTLPMPIFLDGEDDAHPVASGDNFKGKLYQITVKDSGGNATTIYLKVMRDRKGPKFKYDENYYVDSSHRAVVQGGVGYNSGKVFYSKNQAYVELTKADKYSDGTVSNGAAYDEDCGVVVTDKIRREYVYGGSNTHSDDSTVSGTAKYLLTGYGDYPYYYYLYAEDKLGNSTKIDLYVDGNSNPISSQLYYNDTSKPTISSVTMSSSTYGKFDSENKKLSFNYDEQLTYNNGYEKVEGGFQGFDLTVTGSDNSSVTGVTSAVKYGFVSTISNLTSLPEDLFTNSDYQLKNVSSAGSVSFNIVPKNYLDNVDGTANIYLYFVDYAKNLSAGTKIQIVKNLGRPAFSSMNYDTVIDNNGYHYFNKNSSVSVTISDASPIKKYGIYNNFNNAYSDKSFANTKVDLGTSATEKEITKTISFTNFGTEIWSAEGKNATSYTDYLMLIAWNTEGNGTYYYLKQDLNKWSYDASVDAPSNLALPALATGESKITYLDSSENKVYYSKAVCETTDRKFNVSIDFPADVTGIQGYKITILNKTASAPNNTAIKNLTLNKFTGTAAIAPGTGSGVVTRAIPVTANKTTDDDDKKVYIYAVDGLGNVSSAYSFTISKIINAPAITDIYNITVSGGKQKFVNIHNIYVGKNATSVKLTPSIVNDITGTVGFALATDDTGFAGITESDKSFTITFGEELPVGTDGSHTYSIYAKNGVGLYTEDSKAYQFTVIRDAKGPKVSKITLLKADATGASLNLLEEGTGSSKVNNVYYNNGSAYISEVEADDEKIGTSTTTGSGLVAKYLVTSTASGVDTSGSMKTIGTDLILGKRNKASSGLYIAAIDEVDNISYTALSTVDIKVESGSYVKVGNFVFDNSAPAKPNGISLPIGTNGSGLLQKTSGDSNEADIELYYNAALLGTNVTAGKITVTPAQGTSTPAEENFKGFKLGEDGEVGSTVKIPLTGGVVSVYAVDKAGNVSENPYKIKMIEDKDVAKPEFDSFYTAADSDPIAWKDSTGKVIYKNGETSVTLNITFDINDATGIRTYKIGDVTSTSPSIDENGKAQLTLNIPTGTDNKVSIYAIDNVGNTSNALEIEFEKLEHAPDVKGFASGDDDITLTVPEGKTGAKIVKDKTIYVNGNVEKVTIKPTPEHDDVTGIKGFKIGINGTLSSDNTSIVLDVDSSKTSKTYDIYAVNNLNLDSENACTVTIIRDTAGPVVSELTLTALTGRLNYIPSENKLYYNDSSASVSGVIVADNYVDVGMASDGYFAITATKGSETFEKENPAIGNLGKGTDDNTWTSENVWIAAKDMLGNIGYTPLSQVKITIPAASTIPVDGEPKPTVINGTASAAVSYTFIYKTSQPATPTGVTGDYVLTKAKDGKTDEAYLYYKSDLSSLTLTPGSSDSDLAGYFVSYNFNDDTKYTTVSTSLSVNTSKGEARIIAVDKAGNVSKRYKLYLNPVSNPSIKGFAKNNEGKYVISGVDGKVYDGSDETNVIIYVNGSASAITIKPVVSSDPTGIAGFAMLSDGTTPAAATTVTKNEGDSFTFSIDTTDVSSEGKEYSIYAKNNLGLWSEAKTVKVIRDTTGPVVTEITLTPSENKSLRYYESESDLYYNDSATTVSVTGSNDGTGGAGFAGKYKISEDNNSLTESDLAISAALGTPDNVTASTFYIAAVDEVGNIEYTSLNDVKIKIGDDVFDAADFTFHYDIEAPAAPTAIKVPDTLDGNGLYYNADSKTLYFNTDLFEETTVSITPTSTPAYTDVVGYLCYVGSSTEPIWKDNSDVIELPLSSSITSTTAKIYAVDKAWNVAEHELQISIVKDDVAATTLSQVLSTDDNDYSAYINSMSYYANGFNGRTTYYKEGLKLKIKLKASQTPIVAYSLVPYRNKKTPENPSIWNDISVAVSNKDEVVDISLGNITDVITNYALWVKDAVGNKKAYKNEKPSEKGNKLGNPADLGYTWWHLYDNTAVELNNEMDMENHKLKLSGFNTNFPVKSLEFSDFATSEGGMKISKITVYGSDAVDGSYDTETTYDIELDDNFKKTQISKNKDGVYKLDLPNKKGFAYIIRDLEITFDKGAFYFKDGAKVKLVSDEKAKVLSNSDSNSIECTLKNHDEFPESTVYYTLEDAGTEQDPDYKLTITGLWSAYKMQYFSFLYLKDGEKDGISFDSGASLKMKTVIAYKGTEQKAYLSDKSPFTLQDGSYPDGKYCIDFGEWTTVNADKIEIVFDYKPTFASGAQIELAQSGTDYIRYDLNLYVAPTGPNPSIFGRLIDNVSSGISSIFSGRSMTHEELEALKEAKAAKAAARAAEKAAKKAKKNAEIASASPNQGESWTGLSGEFESASSELDSALAKMKEGAASDSGAQDELSSKKSIIKVKSERKNAVSNSRNLITDSHVEKSENHDNRMIYIIGFLAVFGVISGIFAKKLLKKRSKN